ncbi:MAG: Nudix family hydrolase [Betaproteobacteria bacterium]|nr:Nudix family hydrolase [Betaproteobacteria bacterium]
MSSSGHVGEITHAAVGVILRDNGLVLLGQRPAGKPWAGYWEFPGGKVELNETPEHALVRELKEELGISVRQFYPWLTRTYAYPAQYTATGMLESPAKTVKLHFFVVVQWDGDPQGLERQVLSWQNPEHVKVGPMLPANASILNGLGLSPVYAITHLSELGEELFFERLRTAVSHGLMMIQVREKQLSPEDLECFAERVIEMTTPFGAKVFINSDIGLARKLGAAGVHLTSHQLHSMQERPDELLCGASCHNAEELARATQLGLDYVLLSPVQPTHSHEGQAHLGWRGFSNLIKHYPIPVYALGGMTLTDLHTARSHGAHGIAMLRSAWQI